MDWVEDIADQVHLNYKGRKIVIWGNYGTADSINTAFYVDGDGRKVDGRKAFPPECLAGKSDQYYVVVPIAYYPAVRELLVRGVINRM